MFHSIVLTVHNKGWLLSRVLQAILTETLGRFELIVVLDGCTDNSEQITNQTLKGSKVPHKILYTPDVFETLANNAGLKQASGDYCILVQDDMVVEERGWNLRLMKPAETFSDVFAVTANAAHNWKYNPNNTQEKLTEIQPGQWTDIIHCADLVNKKNIDRNVFAIRDSANRGPLLLRTSSLRRLNYLDPAFAPLDMDDHDLCMRAYSQLGQVSGCYWINYLSDISWGSTRSGGKISKIHPESQQKNAKIVWQRHKKIISGLKHNEERVVV